MKNHAERELEILKETTPGSVVIPFTEEIVDLCDKFYDSGQSGGSAPYTAKAISQVVEKLMMFKPIALLTGKDDEWTDITHINDGEPMFQNNRDSRVFKDGKNAKAYFIDAIVFEEEKDGSRFTGGEVKIPSGGEIGSLQYIKEFPFKPKTFYIDVIEYRWADKEKTIPSSTGDWCTYEIKDDTQLKEVFEYYEKQNN